MDIPITVPITGMEVTTIPIIPGVGEDIMVLHITDGDIPITGDPTGPDTITAGIPDTITDRGDIIRRLLTATDIWTADIPTGIPTDPGKFQAVRKDPRPAIPGRFQPGDCPCARGSCGWCWR